MIRIRCHQNALACEPRSSAVLVDVGRFAGQAKRLLQQRLAAAGCGTSGLGRDRAAARTLNRRFRELGISGTKDVADPAKEAGIQKHDILLAIEDTEILDAAQLKNYLIERTTPGQKVAVKVRRVDADITFTVTLGGG